MVKFYIFAALVFAPLITWFVLARMKVKKKEKIIENLPVLKAVAKVV